MDASLRYRLDVIIALLCVLIVLQFLNPDTFLAELLLAVVLVSGFVVGSMRVMQVLAG